MPSAGGLASRAASHFTSPVCSPAEPGGRAAQGEAGPSLCGEVGRQPHNGGSSPAPDAMPQVRGLPADRVRRVPLLQGHEEVRGPRADEAELHHAAVHCGEWAEGMPPPETATACPVASRVLRPPTPGVEVAGLFSSRTSVLFKRMFWQQKALRDAPSGRKGLGSSDFRFSVWLGGVLPCAHLLFLHSLTPSFRR